MPVQTLVPPADSGPRTGVEVWDAVIQAAIASYRRRPFHEVTLEHLSAETGIALDRIRQQFPTGDDLLLGTIGQWNAERMGPILTIASRHGAVAFLRAIVVANVADGALMRLLLAAAHLAASPGHPLAGPLQQQWVQFHAMVQRALAADVEVGREPATMEPPRGAEQLIALYEGLQLQSMVRPNMDLVEAFDRAVSRLRDGWSRDYTPPIWEI